MILHLLAEAAATASNSSGLNIPEVPSPNNIGSVVGGVIAAFVSVISLGYLAYRRVVSDKAADTAGNVQQSVLAQVAALTESNQKVITEERAYSASLKQRLDDEMARAAKRDQDYQTDRAAWAAERQRILAEWEDDREQRQRECDLRNNQLNAQLDSANRRVAGLESQVTRLTETARILGDQLAAQAAKGP